MNTELLKKLPKMDELLKDSRIQMAMDAGRTLLVEALREALEEARQEILSGTMTGAPDFDRIVGSAILKLNKKNQMLLRPVINATGIVLHTNLGRSRLSKHACEAVLAIGGSYSNLEYNIETGGRGTRYQNVVDLIIKLTGAEDAFVVNNNAGAMWLILNAMAKNRRVLLSRGELVEIGGQFRMPDIMAESGSILVEVGTTNKTHLSDYEKNLDEESMLLKVHTSNYKLIGFTEEVSLEELCKLGKKHNVPVVYDLGSGALVNLESYGISGEPFVKKSVADGADVICFSGDKLLGGPQAGIIIGKKTYIEQMKKNPLTRALRIDKLTLAALEATLREYLDEEQAVQNVPALAQILADKAVLRARAESLLAFIQRYEPHAQAEVVEECGQIGGGSMPGLDLKTFAVAVDSGEQSVNALEERLRRCEIPIVARIARDRLILDVLTLEEKDFDYIGRSLAQCLEI